MKRKILSLSLAFALTLAVAFIAGFAQPSLAAYDTGSQFATASHRLEVTARKIEPHTNALAMNKTLSQVRGSVAQAWMGNNGILIADSSAGNQIKDGFQCQCPICTASVRA